ncbi:MAG: RtcB family protein [Parcubacteria group bacterium]|nr:RtcB family protein [Parcubacteria group bacterium]
MSQAPVDAPTKKDLVKIHDYLWEIPRSFRPDMCVPARIYASEKMLGELFKDRSLWQLINLTTLPGVHKYAFVMPDVHEGYGSPVGGIAATRVEDGIISPGMIGYDINCGVRLLRTRVSYEEVKAKIPALTDAIFREVPSGVGRGGWMKLKDKDFDQVLTRGAQWMVEQGHGNQNDLEYAESNGVLVGADSTLVSEHAKNRGRDQLGTIGAGNHFVEVQRVDEIFDEEAARALGLTRGEVTILIHCGSRGLGHQVATDYIKLMMGAMPKYKISLVDRELACAPSRSPEGQKYFAAMKAAANFAWANRQFIMQEVREAWKTVCGESYGMPELVYDVAHNIGKLEEYDGVKVLVHRKGATRAFPPGHSEIPADYAKSCGQPVFIPGSMGTASYVLVGVEQTMKEAFGSSCHGAGRVMSRTKAKQIVRGETLREQLERQGVSIRCGSMAGLAEEAPLAYKDVEAVVDVVANAGIAKKVARLKPVGVTKG